MRFSDYTTKNIDEVFRELKSSEKGLSQEEAGKRLKVYGFNEIRAKEVGLFDIFLRQFKSPFFYLLFLASSIALSIGEIIDSLFILLFVLINVFLGFFQEAKAERAVSLLKKYLPSRIRVLREGKEKIVDKKFLVVGDLVLLEAGNIVPADLRLLKVENFLIDESVLTGESIAVSKMPPSLSKEAKEIFEAANIVFAGTSVVSGEAIGIVIGAGKNTVLGEITKLVSEIKREGLYEKNLLKFSRLILRIVVVTIVFVFLANFIIKGVTNLFDFTIFSIALVVSIIPEALPLVVTFALSQGSLSLARENVIVKRLSAVEDLGNIEILCTDKTGTLTENKLELENIHSKDKEKCLLYGFLSSSFIEEEIESSINSFDLALFKKTPENIRQISNKFKELWEVPFDSFRMRSSVLLKKENGEKILIVKGAPEIILNLSSRFEVDVPKEEIKREIKKEGLGGKRTLAVAFKEFGKDKFSEADESGLTFLGYFSFKDPLKETAKEAIHLAKKLGLEIKILTGDGKEVAGAVAKEIGLVDDPHKAITGEELNSLSEDDFKKNIQEYSVFARLSPRTKYKIVNTLKDHSEVGFLGEGINDAPALKASHAAISVESASDVSREASDIVLLEKDLKVIIDGIRIGRNIFSNINKYIKCTLASNFGNFYSIAAISLFIPFLPMLPIQILLVNLLSDFPLIAVASDKVDAEELRKPKFYQLNQIISLIILLALISTAFDFLFFAIFYKVQPGLLQTLWFIESILTEIVLVFSIRTSHLFVKTRAPAFSLLFISVLTIVLTIILPFTDLGRNFFYFISPPISALFILFVLIFSYFFISEIAKLLYFRQIRKKT